MIYKICSRSVWQVAEKAGLFSGAKVDLQDGFIHFSSAGQVRETAAKHFSGQSDLVLVEFDENDFDDRLKWEVSRGGELFPHLYAELDVTLARRVIDLPLNADGEHQFPFLNTEE